ncbi:MAG TPA: carboxypeptidase-like regulatory domain-containing protein [Solirubrobacteraceae bacterium]
MERGLVLAAFVALAVGTAGALTPSSFVAPVDALVPIAALAPGSAVAGQYHVYSCRTPSGEVAPVDGWSGATAGPGTYALDTCAQPRGSLMAALRAGVERSAGVGSATWTFGAPTGESLAGATLWRAGDADGGVEVNGFYELWLAGPNNVDGPENAFGMCIGDAKCPTGIGAIGEPFSPTNRLVVPSTNLGSHLYANAECGGIPPYNCPTDSGDPNGYAAVIYLYAADLILEQDEGPTASNVSGELASAATVGGTSDVAFSASDPGSGVYEAVFSVDGQVVQRTVVDEDGGRCRNVGQTTDGLPAFLYLQPCPASVSADVGLDTTTMANGAHHLVVSVIDAAGNAATVLDRNITIENAQPPGGQGGQSVAVGGPNGTNASTQATLTVSWKGAKGKRLTSSYGHPQAIVGRLTGVGGVPIKGAHIDVLATPAYAGASAAAMLGPTTGADGRFSMELPAGLSSRTLRVMYSSRAGMPPVATKTLTLSVRAGVTLRVLPRTASVGRSVYFSGRLLGGPIPSGGKLLVLEARSPGGAWLEFDVIRTSSHGRYRASYRFKFPGPARYQFRVLCETEADYPFATGSSHVVGVSER